MNLIILVGISGSGKSTFAINYIKEHTNTLRINRDDIRKTLVGNLEGYYQRKGHQHIENIVTEIETSIFTKLSYNEKSIIIDNTNLTKKYIDRWLELLTYNNYRIKANNYQLQFKFFDCELETAQFRVMNRDETLETDYIKKQVLQYKEIKKYITENYEKHILL